jgi:hypothetical protein
LAENTHIKWSVYERLIISHFINSRLKEPNTLLHSRGFTCCNYYRKGKKLKCTLVQALRFCTDRAAHRGSRGIALLFLDHGTTRGEGSASSPGRSLHRERPGSRCTIGWVGPRACLDRCGKSRLHRDSIPGLSSS